MEMVTICIPTYNSANYIKNVLDSLTMQGEKIKVLLMDNGSKDGTVALIEALLKSKYYPYKIAFYECPYLRKGRVKNIPKIRYELCKIIDTELMMFLDSDVLLPPHAVHYLKQEFEKTENCGMMGVCYEPYANHVLMGAVMLRTEDARHIKWIFDMKGKCECLNAAEQLQAKNLAVKYHPWLMARHLKYV